ncbi:S-adenosyl-L-methionine-dependent methyltransferase [Naematelia encephala]|uniref:S-adenosyl-L-methionine-dependent methyltransferase n=1 Tax=Naematelia encephala TaxID=71784 RepID=A0A1Y2BMJ8_9TREE|nr:S-adenosyl-L-methionine-dependent methyltransferase [Naematelia encephala]
MRSPLSPRAISGLHYTVRQTFLISRRGISTSRNMSYALTSDGSVKHTPTNRPTLPPDTVGAANGPSAAAVDAYLTSKLAPKGQWADDPILEECRRRAAEADMPEIEVSPMQGQFLAVLALGLKATKILEIGTLWGYSTYFLARTLPAHGQIDTLELSPVHAKVANENFLALDLYPFPKVHVGPALESLQKLDIPGTEEGLPAHERGYDLVFIDADKERMYEYFQEALRLTRKGGIIMCDNAVRGGRIALEENDNPSIDVTGLRKLYDWVEQDQGKTVLMSGIQTVGHKFWDGFAIATKL